MLTILACLVAFLFAVPLVVAWTMHNRLVALDQRCETAFADIDVHLKHRQNLIPSLVETVRGFTKHENDILLGVTQARAEALRAVSPEMRLSAEANLTQNINALIGNGRAISRPEGVGPFQRASQGAGRRGKPHHRLAPVLQSGGRRIRCDATASSREAPSPSSAT
jgi:LemA protein